MKLDTIEDFMKAVAEELKKHADRDGCYNCKQILQYPPLKRFMGSKRQ